MSSAVDRCLRATEFIESDHPLVRTFVDEHTVGARDEIERSVRLFYAVRDGIRYEPYTPDLDPSTFRASTSLKRRATFCVPKAIVLAAAARAAGIPARLRFADVRNHLATAKLLAFAKTDVFVFHGYTELLLRDRWIKATPTFDLALCDRFHVHPLDFDGTRDAILHPFDREGKRHMEYLRDHGSFEDLPLDLLLRAYRESYPHFFGPDGAFRAPWAADRDFAREAEAEQAGDAP